MGVFWVFFFLISFIGDNCEWIHRHAGTTPLLTVPMRPCHRCQKTVDMAQQALGLAARPL
jgi:hypothetical protein